MAGEEVLGGSGGRAGAVGESSWRRNNVAVGYREETRRGESNAELYCVCRVECYRDTDVFHVVGFGRDLVVFARNGRQLRRISLRRQALSHREGAVVSSL